jgi:hypothetical protein
LSIDGNPSAGFHTFPRSRALAPPSVARLRRCASSRAPNGLTPVVKSRICVASLRCSSVKYVEYFPSARLGPLATAQFHSVPQPVRCSSGTRKECAGARRGRFPKGDRSESGR